MIAHFRRTLAAVAAAATVTASMTVLGAQTIPGLPTAQAPPATAADDPLKRDTPRGAFLGFISAAQAGNDALAAEYLQWPRSQMSIARPEAARQLMFALNHGFEGDLDRLSRAPEGVLNDGLAAEKERAGTVLLAGGEKADILLHRVAGPNGATIWLVAAETVADIPRLHVESGLPQIERRLPRGLTKTSFGGLPVWVPLALLLLLPIIYLLVRIVLGAVVWLVRFAARLSGHPGHAWLRESWRVLARPTAFLLTVAIHGAVGSRLGIPIYHRYLFNRTVTFLFLAGLVWWLWRLQDLLASRLRAYLEANNAGRAQSAYIIGRRLLQGLTLVITVLIGLAAFGIDLSATLAGLGIGGLALAFAAQKTLENVFAGISVLSDRSIVVGDVCQIGKHVGTVEDVGLRTMRLRTFGRTVVHVPNGTLATTEVENFSRRDKFLLQTTIGLRYETTPGQLSAVLVSIRDLLGSDALVEQDTQRVRFIRLGQYSLDVEIFAYVLAPDYAEFLAHQEVILKRVLELVVEAGTGFAFPSQTLYLNREPK